MTLNATTRILLEKYDPTNPLLVESLQVPVSSPEATTEAVTKEALPVDEEASKEDVAAFQKALELLAAQERAVKLVELVKQTKLNKGKQ